MQLYSALYNTPAVKEISEARANNVGVDVGLLLIHMKNRGFAAMSQ